MCCVVDTRKLIVGQGRPPQRALSTLGIGVGVSCFSTRSMDQELAVSIRRAKGRPVVIGLDEAHWTLGRSRALLLQGGFVIGLLE